MKGLTKFDFQHGGPRCDNKSVTMFDSFVTRQETKGMTQEGVGHREKSGCSGMNGTAFFQRGVWALGDNLTQAEAAYDPL